MDINEFDYHLPLDLIAQHPADKRENSRLLVVHRDTGELNTGIFTTSWTISSRETVWC